MKDLLGEDVLRQVFFCRLINNDSFPVGRKYAKW